MTPRITRHFVTVGQRRVHYLRAGSGPVLAMFHASACSAKVMRAQMEIFATRFTTLAFDTPGFGMSDLLPMDQPETEDLADAAAETLTTLGIDQVATYGRHTGAQIAVEFGVRHPGRCSIALADGFPMFSPTQQWARLNEYLVPLPCSSAGDHLLWLWFRYRDQHVFWPWNEQRLEKRADTDVPDVDFLHRGVIEFLEAGDGYKIGYATAFRHDGARCLREMTKPVCLGVRPGDSLFNTRKLYPSGAWVEVMPREGVAATRAELAILERHRPAGSAPAAPDCAPLAGRTTTQYVDLGDTQVLVRSMGDIRSAEPVVLLGQVPGSSFLYDERVRTLGLTRPTLALDLPGHGESDPLPGNPQSVESWARTTLRVLDALGVGAFHALGHQGGACTVVELALLAGERVRSITLDAPIALTDAEREDIAPRWLAGVEPVTPSWDGTHLVRVWHMRRDMELWWPWYQRRYTSNRATEPRIDPARLTIEVREMMKQPASFAPAWRAVLDYPLARRLALTHQACTLTAAPGDVFAHCLPVARGARPDAPIG